jgi:cysteine-rich repeat protein
MAAPLLADHDNHVAIGSRPGAPRATRTAVAVTRAICDHGGMRHAPAWLATSAVLAIACGTPASILPDSREGEVDAAPRPPDAAGDPDAPSAPDAAPGALDTTLLLQPPALSASATASFEFAAVGAAAVDGYVCVLDGGAPTECASPLELTVTDGPHLLTVAARSAALALDPTPAEAAWTVDTAAPEVAIVAGPAGAAENMAVFEFTVTPADTPTIECQLDGGGFVPCSSPMAAPVLGAGDHTFDVRAIDAAGNDAAEQRGFSIALVCSNQIVEDGETCDDGNGSDADCCGGCGAQARWLALASAHTPPARHFGALVTTGTGVLLFGGTGLGFVPLRDTWTWDGADWTESTAPSGVAERFSTAVAYDAAHDRVVLFGGNNPGNAFLDDTWLWDGATWTDAAPVTRPTGRYMHAMAYDAARGQVILFGGRTAGGVVTETWRWDGVDWAEATPATRPPARIFPMMADDPGRGEVVLVGGQAPDGTSTFADTWTWDGADWTDRQAQLPWPTSQSGMAYDPDLDAIVLLDELGQSVGWNGTTWTPIDAGTTLGRLVVSVAYDPARARLMTFGGMRLGVQVAEPGLFFDASACPEPGVCGDGVVNGGETCDDGNVIDGDGCAADCAPP